MSRGLGKTQRFVMDLLPEHRSVPIDYIKACYGGYPAFYRLSVQATRPIEHQSRLNPAIRLIDSSVNRAIQNLEKRGLVYCLWQEGFVNCPWIHCEDRLFWSVKRVNKVSVVSENNQSSEQHLSTVSG